MTVEECNKIWKLVEQRLEIPYEAALMMVEAVNFAQQSEEFKKLVGTWGVDMLGIAVHRLMEKQTNEN